MRDGGERGGQCSGGEMEKRRRAHRTLLRPFVMRCHIHCICGGFFLGGLFFGDDQVQVDPRVLCAFIQGWCRT